MTIKDELKQLVVNFQKDVRQLYLKIIQYPLISLLFIIAILILIVVPHWQVSRINNATVEGTLENQDRTTLAQIIGGVAIGIGLYYTWRRITIAEEDLKVTQENLRVAQKSQITERFTRAIDQLGNPAIEIRLGGIYALERISKESEEDYWPIMEILTAYIRKNSSVNNQLNENSQKIVPLSMDILANESMKNEVSNEYIVPLDIQAILTVIGRRECSFETQETEKIDLRETNLQNFNLLKANFSNSIFVGANLSGANLARANFSKSFLSGADFSGAKAIQADFKNSNLSMTDLSWVKFINADLSMVFWPGANLTYTDFYGANLQGAKQLTIDQLSQVKTLYKAKLDEDIEKKLRAKYPKLFEEPIFGCYRISAQKE